MAFSAKKYGMKRTDVLRDNRPTTVKIADALRKPNYGTTIYILTAASLWVSPWALAFADVIFVVMGLYFWWLIKQDRSIAFKMPMGAKWKDKNNMGPGKSGQAEGILYLGNTDEGEEMWFSNSDARTHILYLGTTGSGKTEGLKSIVSNAMTWGSGFVYVDGKADTDLWSSLSSLCRRFGRDDDLMVLNYMTGNSDNQSPSNTMNPFSSGSASYLTNMLVSLMPEAEGDNAMWKERAVSLASAMMPVLTWKRDNQDMQLSIRTIRSSLSLGEVVKLSRDEAVPERLREGMKGYLDTLPGFVPDSFDDNGKIKPDGGDTTTASQQHGYLAMQFTRALQSLGDDYGYIFDTQAADVDMVDVVLNRRILIVLIPALEKSGDEIANLGKIVAATMKGMMGSTLGSTVEGTSATVIENKPTHSATPFMTVFDEVGYYTAQGMAVMAAQARSLGFSLVFSGQDLPAMKKRVREEANSITANCNIKIFGKLEDPTETKEFFEKTIGDEIVAEVSGFQTTGGTMKSYFDTKQAGIQHRSVVSYGETRTFKEGEAAVCFGSGKHKAHMFYSNPGHAKAMRVTRFMALPQIDEAIIKHAAAITKLRDLMVDKVWTAKRADVEIETEKEIEALIKGYNEAERAGVDNVQAGISSIVHVHALEKPLEPLPAAKPSAPEEIPAQNEVSDLYASDDNVLKPAAPTAAPEKPTPVAPKSEPIAQAAPPSPPPQKAAPQPVQTQKQVAKLSEDVLKVLREAGSNASRSLFKGKGSIDAAD